MELSSTEKGKTYFSGDYLAVEISGVSLGHFEFEMLIKYPCKWRQKSEFRRKIWVKVKIWKSLVCRWDLKPWEKMSSLGNADGEQKNSRTAPRIVFLSFFSTISFLVIDWCHSHVNLFLLSLTSTSTDSLYSVPPPLCPCVHCFSLLHGSCSQSEADGHDLSCEQVILWLPFTTHSV